MKQKTITLEEAKKAEEILKNLGNRQPRQVSQTRVLSELSGKIAGLIASGWTEQELCAQLAEVMPGLTPASLRFAMRGRGREIQPREIQPPTAETDATLEPSQPLRHRPLRRM